MEADNAKPSRVNLALIETNEDILVRLRWGAEAITAEQVCHARACGHAF